MNNQHGIYQAIANVTADIVAAGGIGKDRKNQQQGYAFRGVEDFLNALAPLLPKHGIVIIPRLVRRELFERTTAKGSVMYHVIADYDFDFCATDGSSVRVGPIVGEAMDMGDKAHNKTLSMAYKYACMLTFCIPTTVEDGDGETHETITRTQVTAPKPVKPVAPPRTEWHEELDIPSPALTGSREFVDEQVQKARAPVPPSLPVSTLPPGVIIPSKQNGGNAIPPKEDAVQDLENLVSSFTRGIKVKEIPEAAMKQYRSQAAAALVKTALGNDDELRHMFIRNLWGKEGLTECNAPELLGLRDWAQRDAAKQYIRAWVDAEVTAPAQELKTAPAT